MQRGTTRDNEILFRKCGYIKVAVSQHNTPTVITSENGALRLYFPHLVRKSVVRRRGPLLGGGQRPHHARKAVRVKVHAAPQHFCLHRRKHRLALVLGRRARPRSVHQALRANVDGSRG